MGNHHCIERWHGAFSKLLLRESHPKLEKLLDTLKMNENIAHLDFIHLKQGRKKMVHSRMGAQNVSEILNSDIWKKKKYLDCCLEYANLTEKKKNQKSYPLQ